MNKYFCSFASGNLSLSTNAGVVVNGTVGKCDLITGDKCYVVTTQGRMFHDKIVQIDNEKSVLYFENVGLFEVKGLTFIGRDDD